MMELHTVKGGAGVIGGELFADAVHHCESHMLENRDDIESIDAIDVKSILGEGTTIENSVPTCGEVYRLLACRCSCGPRMPGAASHPPRMRSAHFT